MVTESIQRNNQAGITVHACVLSVRVRSDGQGDFTLCWQIFDDCQEVGGTGIIPSFASSLLAVLALILLLVHYKRWGAFQAGFSMVKQSTLLCVGWIHLTLASLFYFYSSAPSSILLPSPVTDATLMHLLLSSASGCPA